MSQQTAVFVILGLALGYLAWKAWGRPKDPGCGNCPKG